MKLFALHGHLQNGKRFFGQSRALLRHLSKIGIEFIFLDGPFILPDSPENSPFRSWIQNDSIEETFQIIINAHKEHPDVKGIFGFSMGALVGLILASHSSNFEDSPFKWIEFVIAVSSPFPLENSSLLNFIKLSNIPILFVIGLIDEIIPPERQKKFLEFFPNNIIFEHEGGHFVPSAKVLTINYINFLKDK